MGLKRWGPLLFLFLFSVLLAEIAAARMPRGMCERFRRAGNQTGCLACNIHYESHNQSRIGQKLVGYVTLNRVALGYGRNICKVVYARKQFEWVRKGWDRSRPMSKRKWESAASLAVQVMNEFRTGKPDPQAGRAACSTHFLNLSVQRRRRGGLPRWARMYRRTGRKGGHTFLSNTRSCPIRSSRDRQRLARLFDHGEPLKVRSERAPRRYQTSYKQKPYKKFRPKKRYRKNRRYAYAPKYKPKRRSRYKPHYRSRYKTRDVRLSSGRTYTPGCYTRNGVKRCIGYVAEWVSNYQPGSSGTF